MTRTAIALISEPNTIGFRIERVTIDLTTLQKLVDGYIEAVTGDNWMAYVDEEGKNKNKPINHLSTLYIEDLLPGFTRRDVLVGSVVWFGFALQPGPSGERDFDNDRILQFCIMAAALAGDDNPISFARWGADVWVFDRPVDAVAKLMGLVEQAAGSEDFGTIVFQSALTRDKWKDMSVTVMQRPGMTLHDERDDHVD